MRTKLRVAALLMALIISGIWFLRGPNFGWTKTSVIHMEKDPVTELEGPREEKRFVPGVDLLGAGLLAAGALAGSSFFFRKQP